MSQKTRIAINGFGRIGRNLFRLLLNHPTIEVVAINDIADNRTMAHLLKYDSIHGVLPLVVSYDDSGLIVADKKYVFFHEKEIDKLNWKNLAVDLVVEATGKFLKYNLAEQHLHSGAKKVILSAPPEDDSVKTVVLGVNENILDGSEKIVSNASCTTNNAAPMIKVIQDLCGIEQAYITTVHSYTTDQSLHDQPHKDLRRARACGSNLIPTTTGSATAIAEIFPELRGRLNGHAVRVPLANASLTDCVFEVERQTTAEEVNQFLKLASENELKNILGYEERPLVSIDYCGDPRSSIVDALSTMVINKTQVKIYAWYDNEWGYANRTMELVRLVGETKTKTPS